MLGDKNSQRQQQHVNLNEGQEAKIEVPCDFYTNDAIADCPFAFIIYYILFFNFCFIFISICRFWIIILTISPFNTWDNTINYA